MVDKPTPKWRLLAPRRAGLAAVLMMCALAQAVPAAAEGPALRADMIAALKSLNASLKESNGDDVATRASAQAQRLAGGNAADRWARALFLQIAATARAREGESARAADLLAEARGIDQVPEARALAWLEQEAKLRLRAAQTERGADLLTRWVERSGGDDASRWLLIQARASLDEWDAAADSLDRIRESGDSAAWTASQRRLAGTVYQQAGRFEEALSLLGADADTADVWRRMAGVAERAGDMARAAAIWESGWRRGALIDADDLERLARLHMAGGTPARAAEHLDEWLADGDLEDSVAHRRLLAQAWRAARDRGPALAAWRALAERTGAPDDWQQLAEMAYRWGEWQATLNAFASLRESGGALSGRDWLIQGVAATRLDRVSLAREAFREAKAVGLEQAQQWLDSLGSA